MSKTTKIVVAIVVIVALAAGYMYWKNGTLMPVTDDQPAAAAGVNGASTANDDQGITQDTAAITAQAGATNTAIKTLDQSLTASSAGAVIVQAQATLDLMTKLSTKLQVRISNSGSAQKSLQTKLNAVNRAISDASSQLAAAKNTLAKNPNATALAQVKVQIISAQKYITDGRAAIEAVRNALPAR